MISFVNEVLFLLHINLMKISKDRWEDYMSKMDLIKFLQTIFITYVNIKLSNNFAI